MKYHLVIVLLFTLIILLSSCTQQQPKIEEGVTTNKTLEECSNLCKNKAIDSFLWPDPLDEKTQQEAIAQEIEDTFGLKPQQYSMVCADICTFTERRREIKAIIEKNKGTIEYYDLSGWTPSSDYSTICFSSDLKNTEGAYQHAKNKICSNIGLLQDAQNRTIYEAELKTEDGEDVGIFIEIDGDKKKADIEVEFTNAKDDEEEYKEYDLNTTDITDVISFLTKKHKINEEKLQSVIQNYKVPTIKTAEQTEQIRQDCFAGKFEYLNESKKIFSLSRDRRSHYIEVPPNTAVAYSNTTITKGSPNCLEID